MEITLKQEQLTFFTDRYDVFENGIPIFKARSVFFSFPKRINVVNLNNIEVIRITKAITFFYPEFEIHFTNGTTLSLEGKSWMYEQFNIRIPEGTIQVHQQKGVLLALFLNDEQIGIIKKKKISFFGGDEYNIKANSDIGKELLIAICLAWDIHNSDNGNNIISLDLGNIGTVKKEGIKNWEPLR